jgi:hypothetical protein
MSYSSQESDMILPAREPRAPGGSFYLLQYIDMNKDYLKIIFVVIVIGIGLLIMGGKTKNSSELVKEVCFMKTITDNIGTTTLDIKAQLFKDGTVKGSLNFIPTEKDKMTGVFSGTWKASANATGLDVVDNYFAEGVYGTSTRMIVINDDYATIDWDGPGEIEMSSEQIPKINCK